MHARVVRPCCSSLWGGTTDSSASARPMTAPDLPSCPRESKMPDSMAAVNETAAPPIARNYTWLETARETNHLKYDSKFIEVHLVSAGSFFTSLRVTPDEARSTSLSLKQAVPRASPSPRKTCWACLLVACARPGPVCYSPASETRLNPRWTALD